MGYYGEKRRRVGDVFVLEKARDFSKKWMEYVDGGTALKETGPNADLRRKHDEILGAKSGPGELVGPDNPTGAGAVLGDDD